MENASEGFLQANRNYAQASRDIETVQAGRQAATSGRSEDVISAYQALRLEAQAALIARLSWPTRVIYIPCRTSAREQRKAC
jgi:hypothetical protein